MRMRSPQRLSRACHGCGAELPPFQALAPLLCPNCGRRFRAPPPPPTVTVPLELPPPKPMLLLAAAPAPAPRLGGDTPPPRSGGDPIAFPAVNPKTVSLPPGTIKNRRRSALYNALAAESRFQDQHLQRAGRLLQKLLDRVDPEPDFSEMPITSPCLRETFLYRRRLPNA
jgi:hypothetical protein